MDSHTPEDNSFLKYSQLEETQTSRTSKTARYSEDQLQQLEEFYEGFLDFNCMPNDSSPEMAAITQKTGLQMKQVKAFCWNRRSREYSRKMNLIEKVQRMLDECMKRLKPNSNENEEKQEIEGGLTLKNIEEMNTSLKDVITNQSSLKEDMNILEGMLSKLSFLEKKRGKLKWSVPMHRIFLQALEVLERNRIASPEKILSLMRIYAKDFKVEGIEKLTRYQVASHLQKHKGKKQSTGSCQIESFDASIKDEEDVHTLGGAIKRKQSSSSILGHSDLEFWTPPSKMRRSEIDSIPANMEQSSKSMYTHMPPSFNALSNPLPRDIPPRPLPQQLLNIVPVLIPAYSHHATFSNQNPNMMAFTQVVQRPIAPIPQPQCLYLPVRPIANPPMNPPFAEPFSLPRRNFENANSSHISKNRK